MCSILSTVVVSDRSVTLDDPVGHVLRHETVVVPDDADDRNVDVWEDVGRSANDREATHDHDEYGQYHEGVGSP